MGNVSLYVEGQQRVGHDWATELTDWAFKKQKNNEVKYY